MYRMSPAVAQVAQGKPSRATRKTAIAIAIANRRNPPAKATFSRPDQTTKQSRRFLTSPPLALASIHSRKTTHPLPLPRADDLSHSGHTPLSPPRPYRIASHSIDIRVRVPVPVAPPRPAPRCRWIPAGIEFRFRQPRQRHVTPHPGHRLPLSFHRLHSDPP